METKEPAEIVGLLLVSVSPQESELYALAYFTLLHF